MICKEQWEIIKASYKTENMVKFLEGVEMYTYSSPELDCLVMPLDNSRYINHSPSPNSKLREGNPFSSISTRDIEIGEEIVEDYNQYVCPWCSWEELYGKKFNPF